MDPNCSLQVKSSKEYSEKASYYDRIVSYILDIQDKRYHFNQWKVKALHEWQFSVLDKLMNQDSRSILWVTDSTGNRGKTFLCFYMNILYGFQYLDGMINSRDLLSLMDRSAKGVVFDVCRSSANNFDYGALESLKNGVLVSGKYRGQVKRFRSAMEIAVFSNSFPDLSRLSKDRWDIMNLDNVPINSGNPVIFPASRFPFESIQALPELGEDFDLKEFLEARVGGESNPISDLFASQPFVALNSQPIEGPTDSPQIPSIGRPASEQLLQRPSTSRQQVELQPKLPESTETIESTPDMIIGSFYCQNGNLIIY